MVAEGSLFGAARNSAPVAAIRTWRPALVGAVAREPCQMTANAACSTPKCRSSGGCRADGALATLPSCAGTKEKWINRSRRAFVGKAFAVMSGIIATPLLSLPALGGEDPIPFIDIVVKKTPPGNAIGRMQTDPNGYLKFKFLQAGTYEVSDKFGNKASVKHQGGPVKWRLIGTVNNGKPVWTLVDDDNPL